jgi:hypothetical protein
MIAPKYLSELSDCCPTPNEQEIGMAAGLVRDVHAVHAFIKLFGISIDAEGAPASSEVCGLNWTPGTPWTEAHPIEIISCFGSKKLRGHLGQIWGVIRWEHQTTEP